MASVRAPKQWSLSKEETVTSFENWRQNLLYILSLDPLFAPFLLDGFVWTRKTPTSPLRGMIDDGNDVPEAQRRTAQQKATHLELMLGQIANFCPILSRSSITKSSTSLTSIWHAIRSHFGFQLSGSNFLDFANIKLGRDEKPEDLFQRISAFIDDNLMRTDSDILHHGAAYGLDEDVTPTIENIIVINHCA